MSNKPSLGCQHSLNRPHPPRPSLLQPRLYATRLLLGSVLIAWGSLATVSAQNLGVDLTEHSRFDTDNYANASAFDGRYAYVADGLAGLDIVDLQNPDQPVRAGRLTLGGDARAISHFGHFVAVAVGEPGLKLVDVTQPEHPTLAGTFNSIGQCVDVQVVGNRAYLADGAKGLVILDVTDPKNPKQISAFDTSGDGVGVFVVGDLVYVADGASGLQVVDVSDPTHPTLRGAFPTTSFVQNVFVEGNLAYLATIYSGLLIVDLADLKQPKEIGSFVPNSFGAVHINVSGRYGYLSDLNLGLLVLDLQDPAKVSELGRIPPRDESYHTSWAGDRALLSDGRGGLRLIDFHFGKRQKFLWQGPSADILPLNTPQPLVVTADSGLPVSLQVRGPARLVDGALTITNYGLVTLTADQPGDAVYLSAREIRRVNETFAIATELGSLDTAGTANRVKVQDQIAYVADVEGGLQVLDVSDPTRPVRRGGTGSGREANAVYVVGTMAYVADGAFGLQVVNASNPALPLRVGGFNTPGRAIGVHVVDQIAYVADESSGLQIIDVHNPAAPVRLGGYVTHGAATSVQVVGPYAYIVDTLDGLLVVDISKPDAPVLVGQNDRPGFGSDVQVVGSLAYVTDRSFGRFFIFDVSNPTKPIELSSLTFDSSALSLHVVGQLAYVATGFDGVQIIDVSDPSNPRVLLARSLSNRVTSAFAVGNRLYVTRSDNGLVVLETAAGLPQTLRWDPPQALTFDGRPLPLTAENANGFPVTFAVKRGAASIVNGNLAVRGVGHVQIEAKLAGDDNHLPVVTNRLVEVKMPAAVITRAGESTEVVWPAGLFSAGLEGRDGLDPAQPWQPVTLPSVEENGQVRVRVGGAPQEFFRLTAISTDPAPLEVTGWNRDVVLENRTSGRVTPFDSFGAAWFQNGLDGFTDGLPVDRKIVSKIDPLVVFRLQPYNASNVLSLTSSKPSNSLTLTKPTPLSQLYILAHSAGGGANGTVRVHFADGTSTTPALLYAPDWWDGNADPALRRPAISGLGRIVTLFNNFQHDSVAPGFGMHQTDLDLTTGANAGKPVVRIEFTKGSAAEVTGIFAVSATPWVP